MCVATQVVVMYYLQTELASLERIVKVDLKWRSVGTVNPLLVGTF